MPSWVWNHFKQNGSSVECKVQGCNEKLSFQAKNTSGMIRHLNLIHKITHTVNTEENTVKRQRTMEEFKKRKTSFLEFPPRDRIALIWASNALPYELIQDEMFTAQFSTCIPTGFVLSFFPQVWEGRALNTH